ncbi:hypothetical protein [Pseudomonas sp. BRM28]|uniref:hypothetical protein n=1 Tax=Pseudomonas sp. BRM28 TaxID=2045201 RepID=UPI000CEF0954|nr:hypothetical protein [Pseudomonas sp. BRM28]PPS61043.1 hypothetical protein CR917_08765 [Pseudomonas sp. BRM28]
MSITDQIESLSPKKGDLLVISVPFPLKAEVREKLAGVLKGTTDRLDCELLVLEAGITAQLQPGVSDLLTEQKKQTALLEQIATQNLALIEALSDDQAAGADAVPLTYLSGAPCR